VSREITTTGGWRDAGSPGRHPATASPTANAATTLIATRIREPFSRLVYDAGQ
jgi:hypothetical protein